MTVIETLGKFRQDLTRGVLKMAPRDCFKADTQCWVHNLWVEATKNRASCCKASWFHSLDFTSSSDGERSVPLHIYRYVYYISTFYLNILQLGSYICILMMITHYIHIFYFSFCIYMCDLFLFLDSVGLGVLGAASGEGYVYTHIYIYTLYSHITLPWYIYMSYLHIIFRFVHTYMHFNPTHGCRCNMLYAVCILQYAHATVCTCTCI